ncbi:hypothetical protein MFLAVUS_007005 [Mucor flavus]|uniref:Uncharacterized protein n=1 Tax=Mucor flavus TaxID=439312 RepID=A0ABP9Z332_9FUNG
MTRDSVFDHATPEGAISWTLEHSSICTVNLVIAAKVGINPNSRVFHLYIDTNTPPQAKTSLPSRIRNNKKLIGLINGVVLLYDEDFVTNLLQLVENMSAVQMKPMSLQGFEALTSNKLSLLNSEPTVRERATFYYVLVLNPEVQRYSLDC